MDKPGTKHQHEFKETTEQVRLYRWVAEQGMRTRDTLTAIDTMLVRKCRCGATSIANFERMRV